MYNIIENYNENKIKEIWGIKSMLSDKNARHPHKILDLLIDADFYNFESFKNLDEFVNYVNIIANNSLFTKYENGANQVKGYIFELFNMLFLNYFSTLDIIERNNKIAPRYTFKYCMPIPLEYKDYGIDLLCRVTDKSGESKNAVIQTKYRFAKNSILNADLQDKLFSQGVHNKFIESFDNDYPYKTLILFTDINFDKYRPAFEHNSLYKNLIIIDCNTINNVINNYDFWQYFKNYIKIL